MHAISVHIKQEILNNLQLKMGKVLVRDMKEYRGM
jgi:hypothetical protein